MKNDYRLLTGGLLLIALLAGSVCSAGDAGRLSPTPTKEPMAGGAAELPRLLSGARVVAVHLWAVAEFDEPLLCVFQLPEQHAQDDASRTKLAVYKKSGDLVYERSFGEIREVYTSWALRKPSPQLVIISSQGGSVGVINILDYQDGKITDLINEKENRFEVDAVIRPQLRKGINPAKEAYQVMLTDGVGLASPVDKYTRVYRYNGREYQLFGTVKQQQVDDYLEGLLTTGSAK